MTVGERIRSLRNKAKYSQNKLAERSGVSQSHLRRIELGQADITVEHLQLICDVFNITLKEFFDYTEEQDECSAVIATLSPKQKYLILEFLKSL